MHVKKYKYVSTHKHLNNDFILKSTTCSIKQYVYRNIDIHCCITRFVVNTISTFIPLSTMSHSPNICALAPLVCPQSIDEQCDYNITCRDDDDCDNGQMCCRNGLYGCGYECMDPVASCAVSVQ